MKRRDYERETRIAEAILLAVAVLAVFALAAYLYVISHP